MRSRDDFEQLVFERADKIKAHDRKMKVVRASVLPIAAAFVVLTAVGVGKLPIFSANLSNAVDNAIARPNYQDNAAYSAEKSAERSAERSAEEQEPIENIAPQNAMQFSTEGALKGETKENEIYEDKAAQPSFDAAGENSEDISVRFITNDVITVDDNEKAYELAAALSQPLDEITHTENGFLGAVEVTENGQTSVYKIYSDHITKYENDEPIGEFEPNEQTKALLGECFPIKL